MPDVLEPGDPYGLAISVRCTALPGPTSVRIEALLGLLPVRVIVPPETLHDEGYGNKAP